MRQKKEDTGEFGERLQSLRTMTGMTQQEVADHLQISRSTYAYYETGALMPPYTVLRKLAQEFRVNGDRLLGFEEITPARITVRQSDLPIFESADALSFLGDCNNEERTFLSLFRHMTPEEQQKVLRYCLDILNKTEDGD